LKNDSEIISKIRTLLSEIESEKELINNYVSKNIGMKFIPTAEIKRILINSKTAEAQQCLRWLKEDGVIKARTLFRINFVPLADSLRNDFNKYSSIYKLYLLSTFESNGIISYKVNLYNNKNIVLDLKYKDFAIMFGELITEQSQTDNISFEEILRSCRITDENSIENAMYDFENTIKASSSQYCKCISLKDIDFDYRDVSFYNSLTHEYLEIQLHSFIDSFQKLLYVNDSMSTEKLIQYILANSRKYSLEDYKERNRHRRI